jgi:hypothetical protein
MALTKKPRSMKRARAIAADIAETERSATARDRSIDLLDAARAAGWTGIAPYSTFEPDCHHVECDRCDDSAAVPPGEKPPQHKCPYADDFNS